MWSLEKNKLNEYANQVGLKKREYREYNESFFLVFRDISQLCHSKKEKKCREKRAVLIAQPYA